ncbi:MAG: glycerate kinase [Clostridia bacterium]|nr:glycerate kinase [Clostridia bacterium]
MAKDLTTRHYFNKVEHKEMKEIKLVFASDSFKGSLTQLEISEILSIVAKKVFINPIIENVIVSDGGEGALDAIIRAKNGKIITKEVFDPIFRKILARYGVYEDTAVISMSEASGLPLLTEEEKNPLITTTFGTGELVLSAINEGYKNIIITIGGSATNDGGIGALIALGAKFYLEGGTLAKGVGEELEKIERVDFSPLKKYKDIKFTVLCDVNNPLTGERGATAVYSKQKGATLEMMEILESGMINYENKVFEHLGLAKTQIIGGGAAGGLGFALKIGLNAQMVSGIDYILDLNEFDQKIKGATAIITGEGRIDGQSVQGKVISGILNKANKQGVPVFAIVGSVGKGFEKAYEMGISGVFSIINKPDSLENVLMNSKELYAQTAKSLFETIKAIKKGENYEKRL